MSKISVIVPVYKVEKYLARCVDSILAQTFKDYELILVDDGSPDNCPKMCDEYAAKYDFIKVIHKENGGLSDARNFGIDYAMATESEWITFIDSDDWVHPQYLEILYNACIENSVDISSCGFERVKEFSEEDVGEKVKNTETDIDKIENLIEKKYLYSQFNISTAWARLYKKERWQNIRFPVGRLHEDEFTTYKLLFAVEKIAVIKCELYFYFQNENGIMSTSHIEKKLIDTIYAYIGRANFLYNHHNDIFIKRINSISIYMRNRIIQAKGQGLNVKYTESLFRNFILKYKDYLPLIEKYGYKKWFQGRADKIENFKNDVKLVKKEKGWIYSRMYYIKHFFKAYFGVLNG